MLPLKVILKHLLYITILNCKQNPVNSSILCVLIHKYFNTNFCKKNSSFGVTKKLQQILSHFCKEVLVWGVQIEKKAFGLAKCPPP